MKGMSTSQVRNHKISLLNFLTIQRRSKLKYFNKRKFIQKVKKRLNVQAMEVSSMRHEEKRFCLGKETMQRKPQNTSFCHHHHPPSQNNNNNHIEQ